MPKSKKPRKKTGRIQRAPKFKVIESKFGPLRQYDGEKTIYHPNN